MIGSSNAPVCRRAAFGFSPFDGGAFSPDERAPDFIPEIPASVAVIYEPRGREALLSTDAA
ncbi:hypothetical protein T8T21_02465 [Limimaricola variabilis]|uniref:hypothetical protein n=1 Tax=Limimaricola variabilis TaxID=1492771 RepID=UPI002AC971C1|nr:hypothetical protein [Limimaricola variabilis]WPY95005.1 hypothetical protein T8T21_02465 [Limimaricola variabilis]